MNIVFSSLMRALFCHDLVPDYHGIRRMSEPPSIQGHGPLVQAHNLSLHHLHDLPYESVHAGCPIILCKGLHQAD